MDIMHKWTKVLLLLIHGTCLALSDTNFWIAAGYDLSSQAFSIDSKAIPPDLGMYLPPINRIPVSLDESGFFMSLEMEKPVAYNASGSLKIVLFNPEKSVIKPLLVHNTGTFVEAYGKYHHNQFTYLLGYSLQHDSIKTANLSGTYSDETSRIISSVAAGAEINLNLQTRLSFTTLTTIPFFDDSNPSLVAVHSKYNVRVALAYNIENLQ